MHSHLIPGIDDGAKTVEESVALIKQLVELGYSKIITTPHIMQEYYPNTPAIIQEGLERLRAALKAEGVEVEIEAAAEYYADDYFEQLINSGNLLSFADQHILIEFSTLAAPNNALEVIFQLKTKGYKVILAHPERYTYYADRWEWFEKIHSLECKLQVNLLSLAGHYGPQQKKLGIKLLKNGLVDLLGTDLHHQHHLNKIKGLLKDRSIQKLIRQKAFYNSKL